VTQAAAWLAALGNALDVHTLRIGATPRSTDKKRRDDSGPPDAGHPQVNSSLHTLYTALWRREQPNGPES